MRSVVSFQAIFCCKCIVFCLAPFRFFVVVSVVSFCLCVIMTFWHVFCFLVTGSVLSSNHRFKNKYVIGRICHDRIKHDIGFLSNAVISKEQIYKCECV